MTDARVADARVARALLVASMLLPSWTASAQDDAPPDPPVLEDAMDVDAAGVDAPEEGTTSDSGPPPPRPDRTVEDAIAGTALGVGFVATIVGLVARMFAERAFDRAETAADDDRPSWVAEGNALEVSSTVSWVGAGVLLIGGLTGLYFLQVERDAVELGASLTGLTVRGRF